jgi:ribonuclease J
MDWPSDYAKLSELSSHEYWLCLRISTNSERPGWTPSERVVDAASTQCSNRRKGAIIIASFASLVSRMQQVANAALNYGRKLGFCWPCMIDNAKMARQDGLLELPDNLMIPIDQALNLPDKQVVIMCTGSQGEPYLDHGTAFYGDQRLFDIQQGDTVVLLHTRFLEMKRMFTGTINACSRRGANVIYEAIAPVHVSGHASQEEMNNC